jgi:hypothetical protein
VDVPHVQPKARDATWGKLGRHGGSVVVRGVVDH